MVEHSKTYLGKMERRRKSNRRFLQTMHTLLPPVLLVTQLSLQLLAFCSLFLLVDHAECIMTFPDDSGVYSLFPDEDLKTGRKRLRFDEETTIRNYRDGRDFLVRSYPMLPHDRFHRPVDFSGGSGSSGGGGRPPPIYDDFRDRERDRHRQGRVYFDDSFRTSRFDFHRLTPRPRPIERPVNPIIFETSRRPPPIHHNYPFHDTFPPGPPAIGQSKLPPGASSRASGEDVPPTRIHVFNPESNSFGNPRNAGRGGDENDGPPPSSSSAERAKGPPSNFVETGPPGPESFLNHEEFLEYQKKIAFSRFHEQDASGNGGSSTGGGGGGGSGKKVLFESKEPFEIDGLTPPDKSGEISGKLPTPTTSKAPIKPSIQENQPRHQQHFVPQPDQRQLQRSQQQQQHNHHQQNHGEGQKGRTSGAKTRHSHNADEEAEEERDTGGGEVESDIVHEKGDEVESENGKSEVTQLPPTHITKSGRAYNNKHHHHPQQHQQQHQGSSSSASASEHSSRSIGSKKFTPSISHNEDTGGGGTGFKLPTTAVSYSDEPPNLNGFVPVVPFHLIGGAEQPRAISLERPRQQQQNRIVPHHHHHHEPVYSTTAATTTTSSSTTTPRSVPFTTTYSTTITPTIRSKGEKSNGGFRPSTEVTKSFTPPTPSSSTSSPFSDDNTGNNAGSSGGGAGSPASPILHATAGERSNSETHSKVAITKQQELKRLQKQRQLTSSMHNQHQLVQITPPSSAHSSYSSSAGLFPDIGLSDSSSSSADSADNSDNHNNPGIFTNPIIYSKNSHFLDEEIMVMAPQHPKVPEDKSSSHHPTLPTPTQQLYHLQDTILNIYPPSPSSISSEQNIHSEQKTQYSSNNNDTHFQIQTIRHSIPSTLKDNTIDIKSQSEEHNSVTQLGDDETLNIVKSVSDSEKNTNPKNKEIFDTRAVKIANGIKQGEFLLEGYMINSNEDGGGGSGGGGSNSPSFNGGGSNSLSSRSSASADTDYINNNINEENTSYIPPRHYGLYDYPDHNTPEDNLPTTLLRKNEDEQGIVDTYSSPIIPPASLEKIDEDGSYNNQDNIPLSPVVIPQLPGTTTPDLEQKIINITPTPYLYNEISKNSPTGSSTHSEQGSSTNEDVTGNDYFSKSIGSNEPTVDVEDEPRHNMSPGVVVDDDVEHQVAKAFESEPTPPPELRRTRLSEINEEDNFASNVNAIAPTNPIYSINDFNDNSVAYFPYYDTYGNKINITNKSSGGSSSSNSLLEDSNTSDKISRDDGDGGGGGGGNDEIFNLSSSGEGSAESNQQDRSVSSASSSTSSSSSSSSHANENSSKIVKLSINHANTNHNFIDENHSSISIPVEASLKYDSVPNLSGSSSTNEFGNSIDDLSSSISFNGDNTPLYLESSETLMNKTYYLDGNFNSIHHQSTTNKKNGSNNSLKSSNFIKVTRIKTSSGPASQETAEKTSSTILARSRTSKPAVIVSTSAAGVRPKVVGSVVEAGPAWPGLVSNFLRNNGYNHNHNRSFTATATVRPRGNSGNNPAPPPTTIITSQITHAQVHQQQQQQQIHHHRKQSPHVPLPLPPAAQKLHQEPPTTVKPTEFQLHQIRIPTVSTISSGFISTKNINANPSSSPNNNESKNRNHPANNHNHQKTNNSSSSGVIINRSSANSNLAKQVNSIVNANTNNQNSNQQQLHNYNSTHAIVRRLYSSEEVASSSNSSTGIVQKIHAHISHCPKLHSPTEVICDVHIRQGHGVPNPQLTVGWRRKFYNSTQPDVLLALNKAPASGENGHFDPHHSIVELEPGKNDERLEEFHDRFNVTLAPGISPMLRSVLLIRSVTAPDCGTYQCEVNDGINVLRSETLLFLCH